MAQKKQSRKEIQSETVAENARNQALEHGATAEEADEAYTKALNAAMNNTSVSRDAKPLDKNKDIPAAPKLDPLKGGKTPAYMAWMKKYHPEDFKERYQIYIEKHGLDEIDEKIERQAVLSKKRLASEKAMEALADVEKAEEEANA